jgi:hypothetical protein
MVAVLAILALLIVVALVIGGGDISRESWIEGLILAAFILAACVGFALYMAAHY